jgi:hypothetical protein
MGHTSTYLKSAFNCRISYGDTKYEIVGTRGKGSGTGDFRPVLKLGCSRPTSWNASRRPGGFFLQLQRGAQASSGLAQRSVSLSDFRASGAKAKEGQDGVSLLRTVSKASQPNATASQRAPGRRHRELIRGSL